MILYDLFKVLNEDYCRCTVIVETTKTEKTVLENGHLCNVDNKVLYYIVDEIKVCRNCLSFPTVIIKVIAR